MSGGVDNLRARAQHIGRVVATAVDAVEEAKTLMNAMVERASDGSEEGRLVEVLCHIEDASEKFGEALSSQSILFGEVFVALEDQGREIESQGRMLAALQGDLEREKREAEFFSAFGDKFQYFKRKTAIEMETTWDHLLVGLQDEEAEAEGKGPMHSALVSKLKDKGFSWQDWQNISAVARFANGRFHRGREVTSAALLGQLQRNEVSLPPEVQGTEESLAKLLRSVR